MLAPALHTELSRLRDALAAAPHGGCRRLVEDFAGNVGKSPQTIYTWLAKYAGWTSGRRTRADAGTTRVSNEVLDVLATSTREAVRANGKRTLTMGTAMNIADANGLEINVSRGHMSRLLRTRRMDAKRVMAARNHIELDSPTPNYLHQIDPSLCLLFYMGGRQQIMREQEYNKNKPGSYAGIKLKVWRYVRYDHFSGTIDVRYFEAAGENQASLFDFLLWTWGRQEGRLSYGVPQMLLWDKGSANTSHGIQNLLDALGVEHLTHFTGHAWAKGGVEVSNNIVETRFESRLRFEPVDSVEQLNAAVLSWCRDFNANVLAHEECRLKRASGEPLVRDALWQAILQHPGVLREMPERKVCQWFLHGTAETRRVRNLKISFRHPELGRSAIYDLTEWAEFLGQNMEVGVTPLLMREGAVRIEIEQLGKAPLIVETDPVREFSESGRPATAQMFGEGYSRAKDTLDEKIAKRLAKAAYGDQTATLDDADALRAKQARPFGHLNDGKGLVAHSHLGKTELPTRLLPQAAELDTPAIIAARAARTALAPCSHVEAAKAIRALIGSTWQPATHFPWLSQHYPDGVPPDEIESIAARLQAPAVAQTPLRVVGGMSC